MKSGLPKVFAFVLLLMTLTLTGTVRSDPVVPGNLLDPKTAAEAWNVSVKADHREDCDGPHAVDIGEPPPGWENPRGLGSAVGCCCCYRFRGHAALRCDFRRRYQRIVDRRRGGCRMNGVAACYQRTKDTI